MRAQWHQICVATFSPLPLIVLCVCVCIVYVCLCMCVHVNMVETFLFLLQLHDGHLTRVDTLIASLKVFL